MKNVDRGVANLDSIAGLAWSDLAVANFAATLGKILPELPDPDQALNNLERLVSVSDSLSQKVRKLSSLSTPFYGCLLYTSPSPRD